MGGLQVDASKSNCLELATNVARDSYAVRRGLRRDTYVGTVRFQWNNVTDPGFVVRWVSPGEFVGLAVQSSDGKAQLGRRKDDANISGVVCQQASLARAAGHWGRRYAKESGPAALWAQVPPRVRLRRTQSGMTLCCYPLS